VLVVQGGLIHIAAQNAIFEWSSASSATFLERLQFSTMATSNLQELLRTQEPSQGSDTCTREGETEADVEDVRTDREKRRVHFESSKNRVIGIASSSEIEGDDDYSSEISYESDEDWINTRERSLSFPGNFEDA
jgi:hypothetical protein